ncbi:hypothetical protein ABPG74_014645 [Tetrahymena malaccensis]
MNFQQQQQELQQQQSLQLVREQLINMTNIMQSKPEYFLQDTVHQKSLIQSIEDGFQIFPKGCAFLANQLIHMDIKTASQFSSTFLYKVTQACFNAENTQMGNNLNLLTLISKIACEVPAIFSPVIKKGSFLSKMLSMDVECFCNDEQQFGKALLYVSKILKICGRASLQANHLMLAKQLIFSNFHIIEKDACLFTNYLGLLCTLHPEMSLQEILKYRIPSKLFNLFENAKSLPIPIQTGLAKLIVRYCPSNTDLLKWLLAKAFFVNGGIAYQMTINAFSSKFLISEASIILEAIVSSSNPEINAYYLKIVDHLLCNTGNEISETLLLRWLCKFQLLNHIQSIYFSNIKQNNISEPVKGAILDFVSSVQLKCSNLNTLYGQSTNIITSKLNSIGFTAEIEANKHLLKKNLVQQQQQQQNQTPAAVNNNSN